MSDSHILKDKPTRLDEYIPLILSMPERPRTYCVITYGCQMNAHDSERIAGILELAGMSPASKDDAGLVIINTCCVRDNAERKAQGSVKFLAHRHKSDPSFLLGVCGCMVQSVDAEAESAGDTEKANVARRIFPEADFMIGTYSINSLPEVIYKALISKTTPIKISPNMDDQGEAGRAVRQLKHKAFVNIMYGCDNFCSYCIVPYVRGRERSRELHDILDEIQGLVESGCREVTLLGQNVNSYGKNLSESINFAELLQRIDSLGVERVRFMTSHPKDLSVELMEAICDLPSVCKHIHLPVQSGSDNILTKMNRRYTRREYMEKVSLLRSRVPSKVPLIGITTDVMVGFPGETEQDFLDTLSLVEEACFDSAYTFIYSPRKGTAAASMSGHIDPKTSKDRIERLIMAQEKNTRALLNSLVGSEQTVLIDDISKRDDRRVSGKTDRGISVSLDGSASMIGSFVKLRIMSAGHNTLRGVVI